MSKVLSNFLTLKNINIFPSVYHRRSVLTSTDMAESLVPSTRTGRYDCRRHGLATRRENISDSVFRRLYFVSRLFSFILPFFSVGNLLLAEVENKRIVHKIPVIYPISCLDWQQDKQKVTTPPNEEMERSEEESTVIDDVTFNFIPNNSVQDDDSNYLMDIPSTTNELPSSTSNSDSVDLSFVKNQSDLNVLLIGTENGRLLISIFGIFTCALKDVKYLGGNYKVLKSHLSESFDVLYATVMDETGNISVAIIKTTVISSHSEELFSIAMQYVHLTNLLNYLSQTMLAITEAWESILLEMDSKLAKYAANVPEGAVCADFLDLLMFGVPSDEMEDFLMQDLTDKGLKKLGHSIELSYSNIQKLLLTHMNTCGQNITYHLSELRGMARFTHRYKILGLKEDLVTKAINANGGFLVKAVEVQQVINHSMANYKAFFRWLYVVILRLMDEQVLHEIPKMAQQDLIYITEFLQNFDSIPAKDDSAPSRHKNKFHLEQLGQYLLDSPLTILPNRDNIWSSFLEENECVAENSMVVKPKDNLSLVQQQKVLSKSIHDIFLEPTDIISKNFSLKNEIALSSYDSDERLRLSQINRNESTLIAFLDSPPPANGIHLLEINPSTTLKQTFLHATNFGDGVDLKILDVQFYSLQYLSILLSHAEKPGAYLCQLPLSNVTPRMWETTVLLKKSVLDPILERIDVCKVEGSTMKAIDGMSASGFAVSGSRHVSVVLSDTRHKVQLFEMEADEEEEEDETETTMNNTQDSEAMADESIIFGTTK